MNDYELKINAIKNSFERIKKYKEDEDLLLKPLQDKIKEIHSSYLEKIKLEDNFLERQKDKYADYAHDLAIKAQECPYSSSGSFRTPDEVNISEEGIELEWTIESKYGCDRYEYFKVSWRELFDYETIVE